MPFADNRLLREVLSRHCGDPDKAGEDYRLLTSAFDVPDFVRQMREQDFPRSGSYLGRPPFLWYWVPGSGFGRQHELENALDPEFTRTGFGPGLTHGDPVRLLHALRAVVQYVPQGQRKEITEKLRHTTSHLACVEELLWLRHWKNLKTAERGFASPGAGNSFDWIFNFNDGGLIYGEVKFLPSSWPNLSDGNAFRMMKGALTKKANKQLPATIKLGELRAVLITAYAQPTDLFQNYMAAELADAPNVDALLLWSRVGPLFLMCKNHENAAVLQRRVARPDWRDFDPTDGVLWQRHDQEARREARAEGSRFFPVRATKGEVCAQVLPTREPDPVLMVPRNHTYRATIEFLPETGEPIFTRIPQYL